MNDFTSCKRSFFVVVLFLGHIHFLNAQQLNNELRAKLSVADQKKLQKTDELYAKGTKIEDDINQLSREERKYQLKRLEAADYYQQANDARYKIYTDQIKTFSKKNKEIKGLDFARKNELAAKDSFKLASQWRSAAEKERKISERIKLLTNAEIFENRSIIKLQKTLFSYISWPVGYDQVWLSSQDQNLPVASRPATTPAILSTDSIKKVKPQVVKLADTTSSKPNKDSIAATSLKPKLKAGITTTSVKTKASDSTSTASVKTKKVNDSIPKTLVTPSLKKPGEESLENDSSLYGMVKVKEEQIDQFNEFLKKKHPSQLEDYVIKFNELDYSDVESLKREWYKYQYGRYPDSTQMIELYGDSASFLANHMAKDSSNFANGTLAQNGKNGMNETGNITVTKGKNGKKDRIPVFMNAATRLDTATIAKTDIVKGTKDTPKGKVTTAKVISNTGGNITRTVALPKDGFIFRVQVSACRVALDDKTLQGIYSGGEKIIELNEDNWYKYALGTFTTYKEARKLADQLKIPGAFVIAYLNDKRIKITPAIAFKKGNGSIGADDFDPDMISFRVQIAASKGSISENYLKNIYSGKVAIDIINEDGWHKYSLLAGKTFQEALDLMKQIAVPGAFIVAYHKNIKIDLPTAVKLTK